MSVSDAPGLRASEAQEDLLVEQLAAQIRERMLRQMCEWRPDLAEEQTDTVLRFLDDIGVIRRRARALLNGTEGGSHLL